jgi:hypothetical protein
MKDKTKGITRIDDITTDWVKENFDLDNERKMTIRRPVYSRTDYIVELSTEGMDLDDWVREINKWFDQRIQEENISPSARRKIRQGVDSDYYSCDSSVTFYLEAYLEEEIPETDAKVITRIKNREQAKVRRRNENAKKEKAEAKKIEDEKKLMRQLMKKYKDEL